VQGLSWARRLGQPTERLALRCLAICTGVFFLAMGMNKLAWITEPDLLADRFSVWLPTAGPYARWYLETVAIPGESLFARLVPLAEISTGAALVMGIRVRFVAGVAMFMVLNFHLATGGLSSWSFLRDGTGLPVLGSLLALTLAGDSRRALISSRTPTTGSGVAP
jgi:uncharacterized membrane protein YphA (DoxX/SURF4 family)